VDSSTEDIADAYMERISDSSTEGILCAYMERISDSSTAGILDASTAGILDASTEGIVCAYMEGSDQYMEDIVCAYIEGNDEYMEEKDKYTNEKISEDTELWPEYIITHYDLDPEEIEPWSICKIEYSMNDFDEI